MRRADGRGCRRSCEKVQSAAAMRASVERDKRWVTRGLHLERPARAGGGRGVAGHVPRGVQARHGRPRGDARRHRSEPSRPLGGRPGQPGPSRHRHPVCPRQRRARALPGRAREARRAMRRSGGALVARPGGDSAVRLRARPFRLPRPALAAGHRRQRRRADARLWRTAQAGRIHPRLPRRRRHRRPMPQPEILSRNGSYMAYRRLEEHVGRFRDFLREHGETPEEQELDRGEAHGPLAQRRTARAGAGQGRSGARGRSAAEQRLQLQGDGPAWVCGAAGLAHAAHESARHGART